MDFSLNRSFVLILLKQYTYMHIAHYLAIKSAIAACFARANHDKMWAPNESCFLKILLY